MQSLAILTLAALLEVGGDALIRHGLKDSGWGVVALGGLVLVAYGLMVNMTKWDFSRLMGVYVCLFFLISQIFGVVVFKERPSGLEWLGGALILAGGVVLAVAKGA